MRGHFATVGAVRTAIAKHENRSGRNPDLSYVVIGRLRIAERSATLTRACERVGRNPGTIARTAQALVFVMDDVAAADRLVEQLPMPTMADPPERLRDVVAAYADIGLDELIVPDRTLGEGDVRLATMDRFIEEVAAGFR